MPVVIRWEKITAGLSQMRKVSKKWKMWFLKERKVLKSDKE